MLFVEKNIRNLPQILWCIAPSCFAREPELFLAMIKRLKAAGVEPEQLDSALNVAFESVVDGAGASEAMQKTGFLDQQDKLYRLASVLKTLTAQDPAAAMAFAETHPDSLKTVLSAWSLRKPEAVLDWLRARPQGSIYPNLIVSALGDIAQQRPQWAQELLGMVPSEETVLKWLEKIYERQYAEKGVAAWEQALGQEVVYAGLARSWTTKPLSEVVAWMESLPLKEKWRLSMDSAGNLAKRMPTSSPRCA